MTQEQLTIEDTLKQLLADVFTLYLKTKNFHWHMHGPHFRDYHLLLDEQAAELFVMTDLIAERSRKMGYATIRSVGEVLRLQRIRDDESDSISPEGMLSRLCEDNRTLQSLMLQAHKVCEDGLDLATTSLLDGWIDETERRTWFLNQTVADKMI